MEQLTPNVRKLNAHQLGIVCRECGAVATGMVRKDYRGGKFHDVRLYCAAHHPTNLRVHFLTDWRYVACRSREQKGELRASRDPSDVTCPNCVRVMRRQGYDVPYPKE